MLTFQEIISKLEEYWSQQGCIVLFPYDVEKGAATANPNTIFKSIEDKPVSLCYVEQCRRPQDGRYGENPNRVYKHHQFQVLIKPAPNNIEDLYLKSLEFLGLDRTKNEVKFVEDNWAQPTIGAWGLGAEVRLNGMEVTQFTYFKQVGKVDLAVTPIEISYGLERLAMNLQQVENVYDLQYNQTLKYGDLFKASEYQFSKYSFEVASSKAYSELLDIYISEAKRAIEASLPLPAYDMVLKASHAFNILDAQKAIGQKERQRYILEISRISLDCCKKNMENQK